MADLVGTAAATSRPKERTRPIKDQLNVRISRELLARLDHAILLLSARRGSKLTKADAVEEAITEFLQRHQLNGQTEA